MGHVYIALAGVPATGKSSLCRALIERLRAKSDPLSLLRCDKIAEGLFFPGRRVLMLGKWAEGTKFPGCDALSMAVQPAAQKLCVKAMEWAEKAFLAPITVVADGDRLYNGRMFEFVARHMDLRHFVLEATPDVLAQRHLDRADTQKAAFLAGRATKVRNMQAVWPSVVLANNTPEDARKNLEIVLRAIASRP